MSNTTTPTETTEFKAFNRRMIRHYVEDLREVRADKKHPTLYARGYTVAVKGSPNAVRVADLAKGACDFLGTWNRETSYWSMEAATRVHADLSKRTPLELEVVHRNVLRDRAEKSAEAVLPVLFKIRNKVNAFGA